MKNRNISPLQIILWWNRFIEMSSQCTILYAFANDDVKTDWNLGKKEKLLSLLDWLTDDVKILTVTHSLVLIYNIVYYNIFHRLV